MSKSLCLTVLPNKGQDQRDLAKPGLQNEFLWQSSLHLQRRSSNENEFLPTEKQWKNLCYEIWCTRNKKKCFEGIEIYVAAAVQYMMFTGRPLLVVDIS